MRRDVDGEFFHPAWLRLHKEASLRPRRGARGTPLSAWLRMMLRQEVFAKRHWADRTAVLAYAVATGLLVLWSHRLLHG